MTTPRRAWTGILAAVALAAVALAATAAPAAAQQDDGDGGGRVYGLIGGAFDGGSSIVTGAGAGLRLTPHLGLDLELTYLSGGSGRAAGETWFDGGVSVFRSTGEPAGAAEDYPPLGAGGDDIFPFVEVDDVQRAVTAFLTRITVEFPVAGGRVLPYLTGGGGLARVAESFDVIVDPIPWMGWEAVSAGSRHGRGERGDAESFPEAGHPLGLTWATEYADLGLGLVLGGGVDVRVWHGLGVGIDLRWMRILRNYDALDLAQVTSRVSYRF